MGADPEPVMYISAAGIAFLKQWEGVRYEAYRDSIDLLTIGVGHLLTKSELSSGSGDGKRSGQCFWREAFTPKCRQEYLPTETGIVYIPQPMALVLNRRASLTNKEWSKWQTRSLVEG